MASLENIRDERLKKLAVLQAAGREAYPIKSKPTVTLAEAGKSFKKLSTKRSLTLVGRVVALRGQGALVFFDFNDGTGSLQGLVKKGEAKAEAQELFGQTVDLGDIVEVTGQLFLTKRKEKTILVKDWRMLAKSLRPLPSAWHGLSDPDERFRRRYLDSLMDPVVKGRFVARSKIISTIRGELDQAGFMEVETPMLQPQAGGATALPFTTHHNALDTDLFLRIAPELYLKRMLVGGFPKIYEINRNFRNEGIDVTHNPEFTMLEFYEAYSDATAARALVEKMIKVVVKKVFGKTNLNYQDQNINFAPKFKTISYTKLLEQEAKLVNPLELNREQLAAEAGKRGVAVAPADTKEKILDSIYKKLCRPNLIQPTFIVDYPTNYLPLAKKQLGHEEVVDAFQLIAGGLELVKGFSELNDPLDQRARFMTQEKARQAGDKEAQKLDEDFLEALEYGMPPAGGVGIGIDRLAMLLTDTPNIREVIFFPTLRPK